MTNLLNTVIQSFKNNPRDVKTAPLNKREPKWFYVFIDGDNIYVKSAINHKESSKIQGIRPLDKNNIDIVYECYLQRKAGIKFSNNSLNNSYWFGIFAELGL